MEKYNREKLIESDPASLFNEKYVDYFRCILKSRAKYISIEEFIKNRPVSAEKQIKFGKCIMFRMKTREIFLWKVCRFMKVFYFF